MPLGEGCARAREADRGLDAPAQAGRWRFARQSSTDAPLQRIDALAFGGKDRVGGHTLFHRESVGGIELAIEIGMDGQDRIFVKPGSGHAALLPMALITWSRPRARRDITVPIGTPVTSAISR